MYAYHAGNAGPYRKMTVIDQYEYAAWLGDCSYCLKLKAEDAHRVRRLEDERAEREEEERLEGDL
jgi:hypothetical protein